MGMRQLTRISPVSAFAHTAFVYDFLKEKEYKHKVNWPKGIMVAVVGGLELDVHQIHGGRRRRDEEDLDRKIYLQGY